MTPAKPPLKRAIEEACVAQQRVADAIMGLSAYESPDLEGSLKELQSAQGRLEQARLAVRRAIVERDGEARFPAGNNADLVERDDKGAQRVMAAQQHARADGLEVARAEAGTTSLLDDTASLSNSDRDHRGAA